MRHDLHKVEMLTANRTDTNVLKIAMNLLSSFLTTLESESGVQCTHKIRPTVLGETVNSAQKLLIHLQHYSAHDQRKR